MWAGDDHANAAEPWLLRDELCRSGANPASRLEAARSGRRFIRQWSCASIAASARRQEERRMTMAAAMTAPELDVVRWFNSAPLTLAGLRGRVVVIGAFQMLCPGCVSRSEEHQSELQSLMHKQYAAYLFKKQKNKE